MARRIFVLVAAATFAVSAFAYAADNASDRDCVRVDQEIVQQDTPVQEKATVQQKTTAPAAMVSLEKILAAPMSASVETEDGVEALVGPIEFVIARIGPDGKPVKACVDSAEAARHFFQTRVEKLPAKSAQDQ